VIALREAARKFSAPASAAPPPETSLSQTAAAQGLAGQIETRLTNVVVAALKEAFRPRPRTARARTGAARRRAPPRRGGASARAAAARRSIASWRTCGCSPARRFIGWIASIAVVFVHPSGIPSRIVPRPRLAAAARGARRGVQRAGPHQRGQDGKRRCRRVAAVADDRGARRNRRQPAVVSRGPVQFGRATRRGPGGADGRIT